MTKRRWYQYSLRSLLLFVLVVAIGISAIRIVFDRAFAHNEAVTRITRHWGQVSYSQDDAEPAWKSWGRKCLGNGYVGQVTCVRAPRFAHCRLEDLVALPEVQQLELMGTRVDAAGLAALKSLPRLWTLNLWATNITDDDLVPVGNLNRLEWLKLGYTQITDKGLEHLKSLGNLRLLYLTGTHVTESGVKKLQSALPDCDIEWDGNEKAAGTVSENKTPTDHPNKSPEPPSNAPPRN